MRIVPGDNRQFLIITHDNDVCSFVGRRPDQRVALSADSPPPKAQNSLVAICAGFAESLHRATTPRR
jgi:hypothetical protein